MLPLEPIEAAGFVSGLATVWLTVRQNIWTWPTAIANELLFIVLFWGARLYADSALQVVYLALSAYGWYWWLHGGRNSGRLVVSNISTRDALILGAIGLTCTAALTVVLQAVDDAAPFLDAVTTILSLIAQYMLTRKYLQNWYVWITADVIYIYLYVSRGLPLTAVLYCLFLLMCVVGVREWRRSLASATAG